MLKSLMSTPVGGLLDTEEKLKVGSETEFRMIGVKGDNLTRIYFHIFPCNLREERCRKSATKFLGLRFLIEHKDKMKSQGCNGAWEAHKNT